MRPLQPREMNKRGCIYCLDYRNQKKKPEDTQRTKMCIHPSCPYHELDPYNTYLDYLKSKGGEDLRLILLDNLNLAKESL